MISIGIDVSKGKSMVCICSVQKMLVSPYEIQHTRTALQDLIQSIQSYSEECKVVLEATTICRFFCLCMKQGSLSVLSIPCL